MPPPPAAIQWLVQSTNDRPTIRKEEKMTSSRRASVRTVLAIVLGIAGSWRSSSSRATFGQMNPS